MNLVKKKIDILLLSFVFFSLLISIGSFPDLINFNLYFFTEFNLKNIINFIRKNLILITPLILIIFTNVYAKNLKVSKVNKLFLIYIFTQFIFLSYRYFFDENLLFNFDFYFHFIYCCFLTIFLIIILENINNKYIYINFFYIIYFLILIIFLLTASQMPVLKYLVNENSYGIEMKIDKIVNFVINSNGLGRYYLLAFYLFFYLFLRKIYFCDLKKIIIFFIISIFFSINVILFDSRFLFLAITLGSIIILIFSKIKFKKKILTFFIFSFTVWLILFLILKLNDKKYNELRIHNLQGEKIRYTEVIKKKTIDKRYNFKSEITAIEDGYSDINFFTTGRFEKWNYLINYSLKNYLLGFMPEYDRNILLQKNKNLAGNDAANGAVYALICSGLIGVLVYFVLFYIFLKKIFLLFRSKKLINFENFTLDISIIFGGFIFFRSFFENSFMGWGFDFMLNILCLSYIFLHDKNLNNLSNP